MPRLSLLILSFAILTGCQERNAHYCPNGGNAAGTACIDDAQPGDHCTANSECTKDPKLPFCDTTLAGGTCATCTPDQRSMCMGATPRCEVGACVACVDDSDCGGTGVCLQDGSCAAASSIVHAVSVNGSISSATCGGPGPGNACTLDIAILIATGNTGRNIIKLDDAGPFMSNVPIDADVSANLTIDARGATLHRNSVGPIFTINNNKRMTILGGVIEGAQAGGGGGNGIHCNDNATLGVYGTVIKTSDEAGIAASKCTLTVVNANIHDNSKITGAAKFAGIQVTDGTTTVSRTMITSNRGGGITIGGNGTFTLVGNVFLSNGDPTGNVGGVAASTNLPDNRLEFNTLFDNKSQNGVSSGIQCTAFGPTTLAAPVVLTAKNNIIWANTGDSKQTSGTCLHAYSDIGPTGTIAGNMNINADPKFNSAADLSVTPASPVRGKAAPDADLSGIAAKDVAGKMRTATADIGAYVVPAM